MANLLAAVERRLAREAVRVTEAQRRLILQRLAKADADDTFGLSADAQRSLFVATLAGSIGINPRQVEGHLRSY